MTPERWQQIKHLVNSALIEDAEARTAILQQSCADDFALRLGAEALLSITRKLPDAPLAPDQWQRIEKLFQSALELEPSKRAAFLAEACGDDEVLRHEVESLLVYQGAAGGLIQGAVHEAAGLLPNDEKARFTPGTTLNKRYRILGQLGKGGMGEVYRADDLKLGQPVALKFLTEKLSQDKAMLARFHSEVSMAHRVTHPNVCRVHDIGEVTTSSGNLHFLSMEYVDGEDLSSLLRRIGRLPSDKAVEIANQLCDGLAAAHEAGVLHRDLKPANVMIDGKGRVRITDFGLAGFAEQFKGSEVFAGTPAYMSPEQFAGKEVTTKSDIYALGLVLHEVFTGKRVFEAGSLEELKKMHESSAPKTPSSWVKDLDPLVERVILRCLEKDPGRRLASAKQVADALPGGDPLAAALALGETPSPEMVAAAGSKTGMQPKWAVACLLAIIVGAVCCAFLADRFSLLSKVMRDNSPDALEQKARAIIQQFGYTERPVDWARGLDFDSDYYSYAEGNVSPEKRWEQHTSGQFSALTFWYRQSPRELIPGYFFSRGKVTYDDPVHSVSGMIILRLDSMGRIIEFQATPPEFDPSLAKPLPYDWKTLFAAAGLDLTKFTSVESQWMPLSGFDERAAWTGTYANLHLAIPIRIEAAAYRGRPVYFQIIWPWTKPLRQQHDYRVSSNFLIIIIIFAALLAGAIWLARYNWRNGRGDRNGAFRLAMFIFAAMNLRWLFGGSHTPTLAEIVIFFIVVASQALLGAGVAWLVYIALEPIVRRHWPNVMISWNRLLNGKPRDSLVGRDLLIGIFFSVAMHLEYFFASYLELKLQTGTYRFAGTPLTLIGGRHLLAHLFEELWVNTLVSIFFLLLVLLLRVIVRRQWLAISLFFIFGVGLNVIGATGNSIALALLLSVNYAAIVFILFRYGLLTITTYLVFTYMLEIPIATTFNTWYSIYGLLQVGIVLALAVYAFHTALGGQKLFSGKLLEE